jgi:hypothetical protein
MTCDDDRLWTDRSLLCDVRYRTDANLAARQSLYRWRRPWLNLPPRVLDLAAVRGSETVTDVGCGNDAYPAELARRGHAGPVLGDPGGFAAAVAGLIPCGTFRVRTHTGCLVCR